MKIQAESPAQNIPSAKTTPQQAAAQQAAAQQAASRQAAAAKSSAANSAAAGNAPSAAPSAGGSANPSAAARSMSSMISAAGLPADKLSASIISFARFFSLPLKPELLAEIRRQAFAQQTSRQADQPAAQSSALTQQASPAAKNAHDSAAMNRLALSLAAAAAESKGALLQQKGLEAYAMAIDPGCLRHRYWQQRQESEDHQHGRRDKNHDEHDEDSSSEDNTSKSRDTVQKTSGISASSIKETALASAEKNPLLAMLNRLPGKNGRWIVLPFDFSENGHNFRVSLRILLETENGLDKADFMALDIAENDLAAKTSHQINRRLFVLEGANGRAVRLACYIQSEISVKDRSMLINQLSELLGILPERVSVNNCAEPFPFESFCDDKMLRSIDEAV